MRHVRYFCHFGGKRFLRSAKFGFFLGDFLFKAFTFFNSTARSAAESGAFIFCAFSFLLRRASSVLRSQTIAPFIERYNEICICIHKASLIFCRTHRECSLIKCISSMVDTIFVCRKAQAGVEEYAINRLPFVCGRTNSRNAPAHRKN